MKPMNSIKLMTNTIITAASLAKADVLPAAAAEPYAALTATLTERYPAIDLTRIQIQPNSVRGPRR